MTTPGPDVYQTAAQALSEHSRLTVARVTVDDPGFRAVVDVAFRAGQKDAARDIEQPDSPLCDCPRLENVPTSPETGAAMDHHCDCRAVETAAIMLGAYSKTVHAKQCAHGTELDEFYLPRTPGEDVTP